MHHCSWWWARNSRNISRIHGMLYRDLKKNLNNGWPVIRASLLCLAKNRLKWPQKRQCNVLIDFMSHSLVKTGMQKPTWASFSLTKEFTVRLRVCVWGGVFCWNLRSVQLDLWKGVALGIGKLAVLSPHLLSLLPVATASLFPHLLRSFLHCCSGKCLTTSFLEGKNALIWSVFQSPWCTYSHCGWYKPADTKVELGRDAQERTTV